MIKQTFICDQCHKEMAMEKLYGKITLKKSFGKKEYELFEVCEECYNKTYEFVTKKSPWNRRQNNDTERTIG